MKEILKKVLSFMMAMLMVLQVMAPVAVLAVGEDDEPNQLSFTNYTLDDNTYFEYVPKDDATLIEDDDPEAADKIQIRLTTDDVENIKLIVKKNYALFDDATYDDKEEVQEQFDQLQGLLEEQGLKIDAKVVEVPGKDGEEPSYKIRNNVNIDIFMEENDLDEEFKDQYNVYFLTTLDDPEADEIVEEEMVEPEEYDFVLTQVASDKNDESSEKEESDTSTFLAAIVNVDYYNVYDQYEFDDERQVDVEEQEAAEQEKQDADKQDAKKSADKKTKTEIMTEPAEKQDNEKKDADVKDADNKDNIIEEKDGENEATDDAAELELDDEVKPMAVQADSGVNSTTYPYKLEVSSSQSPRDKDGKEINALPSVGPGNGDYQVWWDFEVDTSPLKADNVKFDKLSISLYGSSKQGLTKFDYFIANSTDNLNNESYIKSGNSVLNTEIINASTQIAKEDIGDKLYIRVKAPIAEYHNTYSIGLRINPDKNYIQNIVNEFTEEFKKLPFLLKFIRGVDQANKIANTTFNLVDSMYTAEVGFPSADKENFYYDNSRTIVAKRVNDLVNEWYALDLLRIGESEDYNLESAKLNPDTKNLLKVYFVPNINGGYTRTTSRIAALAPDGSYKPGTIVSYKFYNQRGRKETNYQFNARLSNKKTDYIAQIEENQNAATEGGNVDLFSQKVSQSQRDGYLSYIENPYSIMRIDRTFDMVECFNAHRNAPTLKSQSNGIYMDRHTDPTGDYLLTRLSTDSPLPNKLREGGQFNQNGLSQGEAMEDLMKRIYFYADQEKKNYSKTHGGDVMHRYIESGMRQKVVHYFTDGMSLHDGYFVFGEGITENNKSWQNDLTLSGGYKAGTQEYNTDTSFYHPGGPNTHESGKMEGLRKLSPGEKQLGDRPFVRNEQIKYANNVLNNVLASYENDSWEKEHKADTVQLVFYSHTENLQELITAHVTDPVTIDKVGSEGEKIEGAEFRFINKKTGEFVDIKPGTSGSNLEYLREGSYAVHETKAPEGYDLIPDFSIEVKREEINADDGSFGLYKIGSDPLRIHVNDGYKTKIVLGDDVPKGPDGKPLVTLNGNELNVRISDPKSDLGEIEFSKKSEGSKDTLLDGAEFTLTRVKSETDHTPLRRIDGTSVYKKTTKGNAGKFEFKQMDEGFYLLEETKAPEGFKKIPNKLIEVKKVEGQGKLVAEFLDKEIEESGVIYDEPIKTKIEFKKTDNATDEDKKSALSGAKFRLYSTEVVGSQVYDETQFSDQKGKFVFENLVKGEYILEELVAPKGYKIPQKLDGDEQFFGWKLIVDQVEGKEELSYKLYKLKTIEDVEKPENELQKIAEDGIINITNKEKTIDVEFQKYIENPDFIETIPESETNKKYIPIDTGELVREDGKPVSFDLYKSDFYGAKIDANPDKEGINPINEDPIISDKNGKFHLKDLKFNGYYILEETTPPDGYQKANPIVLRVVSEALANDGELKVIVRDSNINALVENGNTFAGVIDFREDDRPGKFSIKKTGIMIGEDDVEVGLRRAYFRLYFADEDWNKKKNSEGYDDFIQKVTPGVPLTDEDNNPIPIEDLPENQGIVTFDQLAPGNYILEEYRGPAGYEKDPNPWYIQVRRDGSVVKSRSKDDPNLSNVGRIPVRPVSLIDKMKTSFVNLFDLDDTDMFVAASEDENLADVIVEASENRPEEGARDVTVKVIPKTDTKPGNPKKLHMILMIDRSKTNQDQAQGYTVDNNINKFLFDLYHKTNDIGADVDISFIEYAGNYSKYIGTRNLKELHNNAKNLEYWESWFYGDETNGGLRTVTSPETIKNYLGELSLRGISGTADGSDYVKKNLDSYLQSIQADKDKLGKTYDADIAVNFAKFSVENLKETNGSYDIISNMQTLQNKGYDTWTYHSDLRFPKTDARKNEIAAYNAAIKNFVDSSDGKSRFEYRKADAQYQEDNASNAPYVQKAMMKDDFLAVKKYFALTAGEGTSRVKDAVFKINLESPLVTENWQVGVYKGQKLERSIKDTDIIKQDEFNLEIKNLNLEPDEHLKVMYTAKLKESVDREIYKNLSLTVGQKTEAWPTNLMVSKKADSTILRKPGGGKATVDVKLNYNNDPQDNPDGRAGRVKLQMKNGDDWYDIREYDDRTNTDGPLVQQDVPFAGEVAFDQIQVKDTSGKKIEYRLVYTRNSPHYTNWGEPEVSYYDVTFDSDAADATATINISNGNLLTIFNKNEDGFRIPLRITKVNDDNTLLEGSTFKARKIINGEEVNGKTPKYADDGFDAVSEATGLAGDNYFRELTPGIYELWEETEPNGYKKLSDKWYFKITVDPDKKPGEANYMYMDFNFKYTFPDSLDDEQYNADFKEYYESLSPEEQKEIDDRIIGKTVYGLNYGKEDPNSDNKPDISHEGQDESGFENFLNNIELVPDDGRSNPARPDAPYQGIDDAKVTNHREAGELTFKKINSKGKNIEGAEFRLTKINAEKDEEGNWQPIFKDDKPDPEKIEGTNTNAFVQYATSMIATGVNFTGIPEGVYALEEVRSAPGYKKIDGYLIINFTENDLGEIVQKVDSINSDKEFLKKINTSADGNSKLVSIENEDNLTDFEFVKVNTDDQPILSTVFTLQEVDEEEKPVINGYSKTIEGYYMAKFKFEGLKEGRYKLTEKPNSSHETPAPWYLRVKPNEDGQLVIEIENNDGSIKYGTIKDSNGETITDSEGKDIKSYKVANYKKTHINFTKVERNTDNSEQPLSDIWFKLTKVRTEATDNGKQIYKEENNEPVLDQEGNPILDEELKDYQYEKTARSDRDGSIFFGELDQGVYLLEEDRSSIPDYLKQNDQNKWIIQVKRGEKELVAKYDKEYEADYFYDHDRKYYEEEYSVKDYEHNDLITNITGENGNSDGEKQSYKIANLVDGVDLRWKKVDSNYGATIEKDSEFDFFKVSDDPNDLENENIFKMKADILGQEPGEDATDEEKKAYEDKKAEYDLQSKIVPYQGTFEVQGLDEGLYKIVETNAPEGYIGAKNSFLAQIKEGEQGDLEVKYYEINDKEKLLIDDPSRFEYIRTNENEVEFDSHNFIGVENTPTHPTGTLAINKTDVNEKALEDAEFSLLNLDGEPVKTVRSGKDGRAVFIDIAPGNYILKETEAPFGYDATTKTWSVYVASDGKTYVEEMGNEVPDLGDYEGQNVTDQVKLDTNNSSVSFNDKDGNGNLHMDTEEDNIIVKMKLNIEGKVNPGDYFVIHESDTLHYNMLQPDKPNYPDIVDEDGKTVLAEWSYGPDFNMQKGSGKDIYYIFTDAVKDKDDISMDLTWGHAVNRNFAYRQGTYEFYAQVGGKTENKIFNNITIYYDKYSVDASSKQMSINANYLYTNDQNGKYSQIAYINPGETNFNDPAIKGKNFEVWVYPSRNPAAFNMADVSDKKTKISVYKVEKDKYKGGIGNQFRVPETVVFDESKLELVDPSKYSVAYEDITVGNELVKAAKISFKESIGDDVYLIKVDSEMVFPDKSNTKDTALVQAVEFKANIYGNTNVEIDKLNGILTNVSDASGHGDNDYKPPELDVENELHVDNKGRFELNKVDENGANLPGAMFALKQGDEIIKEAISGTNGKVIFDNLKPGTYTVEETKAPEGYETIKDKWMVTVDANGVTEVTKIDSVAASMRYGISTFFGKMKELPTAAKNNFSNFFDDLLPVNLPEGTKPEEIQFRNTGKTDVGVATVTTSAEHLGKANGKDQFKVQTDIKVKEDAPEEKVDVVIVLSINYLYYFKQGEGYVAEETLLKAIQDILDSYGENVKVGLVLYEQRNVKEIDLTSDKNAIIDGITSIKQSYRNNPNGNHIANALNKASSYLENDPGRRKEIIHLVNGTGSNTTNLTKEINNIKNSDVNIHNYFIGNSDYFNTANGIWTSYGLPVRDATIGNRENLIKELPSYTPIDKGTFKISLNDDFEFAAGSTRSNKSYDSEQWHSSYNKGTKTIDLKPGELTVKKGETATIYFNVNSVKDIEKNTDYPLINDITFSKDQNSPEKTVEASSLFVENTIEEMKVTVNNDHEGDTLPNETINFTLSRKLKDGSVVETVESGSLDLDGREEFTVDKTDAEGVEYEYDLTDVSSSTDKIIAEKPTTKVSGGDGEITINSKTRDKFKIENIDWGELSEGTITVDLDKGGPIKINAPQSELESLDIEPDAKITGVRIDNSDYEASYTGESSPYQIVVSPKDKFIVNVNWNGLPQKGTITATLSDGGSIEVPHSGYSSTEPNPDKITIGDVSITGDDYNVSLTSTDGKSPYTINVTEKEQFIVNLDWGDLTPVGKITIKLDNGETRTLDNNLKENVIEGEGISATTQMTEASINVEGYKLTVTGTPLDEPTTFGDTVTDIEGYSPYTIEVSRDSDIPKETVENKKAPRGHFQIKKTDGKDIDKVLEGAVFVLKKQVLDDNGDPAIDEATGKPIFEEVKRISTDEKGIAIFDDLLEGEYTLEELAAPKDYLKTDKIWKVKVDEEGKVTVKSYIEPSQEEKEIVTLNDSEYASFWSRYWDGYRYQNRDEVRVRQELLKTDQEGVYQLTIRFEGLVTNFNDSKNAVATFNTDNFDVTYNGTSKETATWNFARDNTGNYPYVFLVKPKNFEAGDTLQPITKFEWNGSSLPLKNDEGKYNYATMTKVKETTTIPGQDQEIDLGDNNELSIPNEQKPKANIKLHKKDGLDLTKALEGVEFKLTKIDENNKPIEGVEAKSVKGFTGKDGNLTFKDVAEGRYKLEEVTELYGYSKILIDIIVEVDEDGKATYTRVFKEESAPDKAKTFATKDIMYDIQFLPASGEALPYTVDLYADDDGNKILDSKKTGSGTFTQELNKNYYVKLTFDDKNENKNWKVSYIKTANNMVQLIAYKDDFYERIPDEGIQIRNFPELVGNTKLQVIKRDADDQKTIKGVKFRLTSSNGYDKVFETDGNGEINIDNLPNGVYTITEISAPPGYVVDHTPKEIIIGGDYKVPENVEGNDVTDRISFDGDTALKVSNPEGDKQDPKVVMPNESEAFSITSKYKIGEGIKPGDYFYLDISDNMNTWGVYVSEGKRLTLSGPMGVLAFGEFVNGEKDAQGKTHYGIKYTFTNHLNALYPETASSLISYFVEQEKVPTSQQIKVYTSLGDLQDKDKTKTHDLKVYYVPTSYTGAMGSPGYQNSANSSSRLVEVDWDTNTYKEIIYVNRYGNNLTNTARLHFGHAGDSNTPSYLDISDQDDIKIYRVPRAQIKDKMPESFGIDTSKLTDVTEGYKNAGSIYRRDYTISAGTRYIPGDHWIVNFGNEMRNGDAFVVVITGHLKDAGRLNTIWFRQILDLNSSWNGSQHVSSNYALSATFNKPYENASTADGNLELTIPNSKNKVQYFKQDDKGTPLKGAIFELRKKNDQGLYEDIGKEKVTTDETGLVSWTGLLIGDYQVWEVKAPDGYEPVPNQEKYSAEEGKNVTNKVGKLVKTFKIKDDGSVTKPENPDLGNPGDTPQRARSEGNNTQTPMLNENLQSNNSDIIINRKAPTDLTLVKKDAKDDNSKLAGAEFSLYKLKDGKPQDTKFDVTASDLADNFDKISVEEDGETKDVFTTDQDGEITFSKLYDGIYYLHEVKAPNGYANMSKTIGPITIQDGKIEIPEENAPNKENDLYELSNKGADGKDKNTVTVYNRKAIFPNTGGFGPLFIVLAGLLMMATSWALYKKKDARNQVE